jgi:hypothetical protein
MSNVNVRLKKYNFIMRKIEVVLAEEAYGFDVSEKFANSHEKIAWKCSNNHIWVEKIINRIENNINCPKCESKN